MCVWPVELISLSVYYTSLRLFLIKFVVSWSAKCVCVLLIDFSLGLVVISRIGSSIVPIGSQVTQVVILLLTGTQDQVMPVSRDLAYTSFDR